MANKFDVAGLIAGLDEQQQAALYTALSYSRVKKAVADTTRLQHDYWDSINDALNLPPSQAHPLSAFLKGYGATKFDGHVSDLERLIDKGCDNATLHPVQRQTLRIHVHKAFAKYLRSKGREATPRQLLEAGADRLAYALDFAFPGYLRAGMLHRVVPAQKNSVSV